MKTTSIRNLLFAMAFLGLVFASPVVSFLTPDATISQAENRAMTQWEDLKNTENLSTFFQKFDLYANDQFGLRQQLLKIHQVVQKRFPSKFSAQVVEGKESWHFLANALDSYQGRFKETQVDKFISQIENFVAQAYPTPVVFLIVPNKAFVYEDFLPEHIQVSEQRQKIVGALQKIPNLYVIDALEAVKASKEPTYMRHETHWNGWGAYLAYKETILKLKEKFSWPLLLKTDIKEIKPKLDHRGDLAKMLPFNAESIDANNKVVFLETYASQTPKHYPTAAQIPDFKNPKGWGRVFVVHDSFTEHHLGDYLAESFAEMINFWSFDFEKAAIYEKEAKPDLILIQAVDRNIR